MICGIERNNRGLSRFAYPTNEVKSKKSKVKNLKAKEDISIYYSNYRQPSKLWVVILFHDKV